MERMAMVDNNGWDEYGKHVLAELKRQNENMEEANKRLITIEVEIAMLKVKAGIWGLIGASIPVCVMLAINFLKG